jgi:hypothetical protein
MHCKLINTYVTLCEIRAGNTFAQRVARWGGVGFSANPSTFKPVNFERERHLRGVSPEGGLTSFGLALAALLALTEISQPLQKSVNFSFTIPNIKN